ncbi:hypothetical protein [Tessaracoccus flavus]|uniref:hypothetical protein n=1 Tax=Tessaracoccus flavus TaxID=1610493 RepID=UPI00115F807C|nr:hypothetical protein [Tessaracoccus flavus]
MKTIRRRIAEGALPVVRSGRSLHLDPKDVDALLRRYPQRTPSEFSSVALRPARRASSPLQQEQSAHEVAGRPR